MTWALAEIVVALTGAHLERISVYCGLIARAMSKAQTFIDDDWIQTLSVASSMHDIGKVGIPDAVLCKPGRLICCSRASCLVAVRATRGAVRTGSQTRIEPAALRCARR